MNGVDFIRRRFEVLYQSDAAGRIIQSNERDPRPAPRFHLMRTAVAVAARYRFDVPADVVEEIAAAVAREPIGADLRAPPAFSERYKAALARLSPLDAVWSGPAFRFGDDLRSDLSTILVEREADHASARALRGRFDDRSHDAAFRQPFVAVLEDGRATAICASVRISDSLHCAGVETHPDHRRRGHAAAATAAWALAVRKLGAEPLYSTSWDNIASQGVARKLGLAQAAADFHLA